MAGAAIGAIFSIFSGMKQMSAAKEAADAQKKQAKASQAMANTKAKQERRSAWRTAQITQENQKAAVVQAGATAGGGTSAMTNTATNVGLANVGGINANLQSQKQIAKYQGKEADAMGKMAQAQAIGQIGGAVGNLVGSIFG